MKSKLLKLIVIFIMFVPFVVLADSGQLTLSCTASEVSPGDEFSCNLGVTYDGTISSMIIGYTLHESLTYVSFVPSNSIQLQNNPAEAGNITFITSGTPLSGTASIGTFNLKVDNDFTDDKVTLTVKVNTAYGQAPELADISSEIGQTSVNIPKRGTTNPEQPTVTKGLKSLTATNGQLSPPFSSSNYSYVLTLTNERITTFGLSATANNSSDTITYTNVDTNTTITDSSSITYATEPNKTSMEIEIRVGTGDTATNYTVLVVRPTSSGGSDDNPSTDPGESGSGSSENNQGSGSGSNGNSGNNTNSHSGNNNSTNAVSNPTTGSAAVWGVLFVLITSVVASLLIYLKKINV